ncbi:MAG TPA: class I SAM-dependent methyltransferase [Candidatus Binatia bacterium]|jgi:SAM-dependent methyltransferase|nr:class I SAM-dependent methyltransferase [Candidatus Binatia bacterium]
MAEQLIYRRPEDYDLEHEGDDADVAFHLALVERSQPRRVLELACGSGRVTFPLAELGARVGFDVVGLEPSAPMREEAERRRAELPPRVREHVQIVDGDMRSWHAVEPFDLIVTPCGSITHLLSRDDRLATWRAARANLTPSGAFAIDVPMPDLAAYTDSLRTPARAVVEIDSDTQDDEGRRLLRSKTTEYDAVTQRARIRFVYDRFERERHTDRFVSDFESHVYHPEELRLLYLHCGFVVDAEYGDYRFRPPRVRSRTLVMVGRLAE